MKSIQCKKLFISFVLFVTLLLGLKAQEKVLVSNKPEVYLDKLQDIKIEKLVFYQNPIFIEYKKLTDNYVPEWYPAFCANGYFDFFKDYPKEAVKYFHSISDVTTEQLSKPIQIIREKGLSLKELYPNPFEYVYGEIWFTYKKTNEKIVLVMGYLPPTKVVDFSFRDIYSASEESSNDPFKNMANYQQPYIYEDNLLKRANLSYVFNEILKSQSILWKGTTYRSFSVLLTNSLFYTRSRLINGKRIFETVKNTTNGPVVIDRNDEPHGIQLWYLKYLWVVLAGLVFIVLLVFLIRRKSKK